MSDTVTLSFPTICQRLDALTLPPVDVVVGIGQGGAVPASLAAYKLGCPLRMMRISYRDAANTPQYPAPRLLEGPDLPPDGARRVLLVDDVSVTGQTLARAADALSGHHITTLVLKGTADLVLFPEVAACVAWPWKTT
jgi:hypoxanthine phosphoribosyltransferase